MPFALLEMGACEHFYSFARLNDTVQKRGIILFNGIFGIVFHIDMVAMIFCYFHFNVHREHIPNVSVCMCARDGILYLNVLYA